MNKTFISIALLTSQGMLFGVDNSSSMQEKLTELEKKIDSLSIKNSCGCVQPLSLSASIEKGIKVDAEFLYWKPAMENIEFFEKHDVTNPNGSPLFLDIAYEDYKFKWSPGFKVGVGYIFSREQWDLSLNWTHLFSKASRSAKTPESEILSTTFLKPNWLPLLIGGIADSAHGHWSLAFNTLDLELGRNFFIGRWMAFHPFAGIRGVWIEQKMKDKYHSAFLYTYTNVPFPPRPVEAFCSTSFGAKKSFKGVGIRGGLDIEWNLSCQWAILSSFSASLISAWTKIKEKIDGAQLKSFDGANVVLAKEFVNLDDVTRQRVRPEIEGELGIQWQRFLCKNKYQIKVSAAYFASVWFSQNELIDFVVSRDSYLITPDAQLDNVFLNNVRRTGDFQLQGLNLAAQFAF